MAAKKPQNREKEYLQSLKAAKAATRSLKSNSPSASTRRQTATARYSKAYDKFKPSKRERVTSVLSVPVYLAKRQLPTTKSYDKKRQVERRFAVEQEKQDKDMARARRLVNAKKNAKKRIR